MKAIQTKILPVTDTLPTRIKVSAEGVPSKVWSKCQLENEIESFRENEIHEYAARKFALLNNWPDALVSGGLPDGSWCHCFLAAKRELPAPPPPPEKLFTVVTVSSNTNSFGYKSVLCLAENGEGIEFLVQAYGGDVVPARGDKVRKDDPRWFGAPRALPSITAKLAAKVLKEI